MFNDRGISPVVGVIILVGIVVLLNVTFFIFVVEYSHLLTENNDIASFDSSFDEERNLIELTHTHGDSIDYNNINVIVDGYVMPLRSSHDQVSAGDSLVVDFSILGDLSDDTQIQLIHTKDSNENVIYSTELRDVSPSNINYATEIIVNNSDPNTYDEIQNAIDNSSSGGYIVVHEGESQNGEPYEGFEINKDGIIIKGENEEHKPLIQSDEEGVIISSEGSSVSKLQLDSSRDSIYINDATLSSIYKIDILNAEGFHGLFVDGGNDIFVREIIFEENSTGDLSIFTRNVNNIELDSIEIREENGYQTLRGSNVIVSNSNILTDKRFNFEVSNGVIYNNTIVSNNTDREAINIDSSGKIHILKNEVGGGNESILVRRGSVEISNNIFSNSQNGVTFSETYTQDYTLENNTFENI